METLSSKQHLDRVRQRLGFDNFFVVDPVGRSGGLVLLWKVNVNLEIYNYSRRHINVVVNDGEGYPLWKLTSFYGHLDGRKREESRALLRHLKTLQTGPMALRG